MPFVVRAGGAIALALVVSLSVSGCSEARRAMGFEKQPPDEFQVVQRAPLALPPEFSLRPPAPAPVLFATRGGFTWRGATGANHYTIERAASPAGPWEVRAVGLHDSVVAHPEQVLALEGKRGPAGGPAGDPRPVALWFDESAAPGSTWHYRIRGFNAAGATDWSPVLTVTKP